MPVLRNQHETIGLDPANFAEVYTCNPPHRVPPPQTHFTLLREHYSSAVAVMRISIV